MVWNGLLKNIEHGADMKEELDSYLCKTYPKLFVNRDLPMTETAMCWGFSCGDGWFNIINQLCANIQHVIDWSIQRNESALKWNAENPDDLRDVPKIVQQVTVDQVKEKFGGLRFYYSGGDDKISGMVSMAESMASVTCEECGNAGEGRYGSWLRTLCDKHEEEYQERMKDRFKDE